MNVINVVPLSRQHGLETLSYYSDKTINLGSVISVPIRNKSYLAVVISNEPLKYSRAELKSRNYQLKPLNVSKIEYTLPVGLIKAAIKTAEFYNGEVSTILNLWLSKKILVDDSGQDLGPESNGPAQSKLLNGLVQYWQCNTAEFIIQYTRLFRTYPDPKIVIICADQNEVEYFALILKDYKPTTLHGKTGQTKLKNSIAKNLIIATRSFGPILALQYDHMIITNPGGETWRERRRPHFNWDYATLCTAKQLGKKTYIWSQVLDSESWHEAKNNKSATSKFLNDWHALDKYSVVEHSSNSQSIEDIVFNSKIKQFISNKVSENKKIILYVTRKGLYPVLGCRDCRTTTYTKKFIDQIKNWQSNNLIADWVDPETAEQWTERCPKCSSWRLEPVALSIGQTHEALLKFISPEKIFLVDTVNQSRSQSKAVVKEFENNNGILLTTQRGIFLINEPIDNTIVVSIDAALTSNSLNVETRLLRQLLYLYDLTKDCFILQTRLSNNPVLDVFQSGKVRNYQDNTLQERELLNFPPFYVQVKITTPVSYSYNVELTTRIKEIVDEYNTNLVDQIYVSELPGLEPVKILVVSIPKPVWDDSLQISSLRSLLKNLPLEINFVINPDLLL